MIRTVLLAALLASPAAAALAPPEARMVTAVDAGQAKSLTLVQQLVKQNSGSNNIAGVTAVGVIMRRELDALGQSTGLVRAQL